MVHLFVWFIDMIPDCPAFEYPYVYHIEDHECGVAWEDAYVSEYQYNDQKTPGYEWLGQQIFPRYCGTYGD